MRRRRGGANRLINCRRDPPSKVLAARISMSHLVPLLEFNQLGSQLPEEISDWPKALAGCSSSKSTPHQMVLIQFSHSSLQGMKRWLLQTALLALNLDGAQKVADARPFGLQINPLHNCADERLNLRIK